MARNKDLIAAAKATRAARPFTSTAVVNFFLTTFLPILPGVLTAATPKIMKSPKLLAVLKAAKPVVDGILEQAGEGEEE